MTMKAQKFSKDPIHNLIWKLKNCNQTRVCESLHRASGKSYHSSLFSRFINGRQKPSRDFAKALAGEFKCSTDEIFAASDRFMKRPRAPGRGVKNWDKTGPSKKKGKEK